MGNYSQLMRSAPLANAITASQTAPLDQTYQSKLAARLSLEEGYRQFPYKDTRGVLTIAHGRNLESDGIYPDEAEFLLQNDINRKIHDLLTAFPWFATLDQPRKCALIDMCFQMGIHGLLGFHDFLSSMQRGDYHMAYQHMLQSAWAREVPNRAHSVSYIIETGIF